MLPNSRQIKDITAKRKFLVNEELSEREKVGSVQNTCRKNENKLQCFLKLRCYAFSTILPVSEFSAGKCYCCG